MDERKERGDRGEAAVADWLQARGCCLLERQFRCRYGEIDLIARDREGTVCFIEVKTRSSSRFAQAREGLGEAACRFDVAEVYPDGGWDRPRINYIISAF